MKLHTQITLLVITFLLSLCSGCKKESSSTKQKDENTHLRASCPEPDVSQPDAPQSNPPQSDNRFQLLLKDSSVTPTAPSPSTNRTVDQRSFALSFTIMNDAQLTQKKCEEYFTIGGLYGKVVKITIKESQIDLGCFGKFPNTLTELVLSDIEFRGSYPRNPWFQLFHELDNKYPNLKVLKIEYADLGQRVARLIATKLRSLKHLSLVETSINSQGAIEIAQKLKALTHLDLSKNQITREGLEGIANHLTNLIELNLAGNPIEFHGPVVLAIGNLEKLKKLTLGTKVTSTEGATEIADLKLLNLNPLELNNPKVDVGELNHPKGDEDEADNTKLNEDEANNVKQEEDEASNAKVDEGEGTITAGEKFKKLTHLTLIGMNLDVLIGTKVITHRNFPKLTHLLLVGSPLKTEVLRALGHGDLPNLTTLVLEDANLDAAGMGALAQGNLTKLVTLMLARCYLNAAGVEALTHGNLTNLTTLILENTTLDAAAAEVLADGELPNLTTLVLEHANLDEAGTQELVLGKLIHHLSHLALIHNAIGDQGARALISANPSSLTHLFVLDNSISDDEVKDLTIQDNLSKRTKKIIIGNGHSIGLGRDAECIKWLDRVFSKILGRCGVN